VLVVLVLLVLLVRVYAYSGLENGFDLSRNLQYSVLILTWIFILAFFGIGFGIERFEILYPKISVHVRGTGIKGTRYKYRYMYEVQV
jgi:hypothetical protein